MSGDLRTNSILGAVLGSVLGVMAIGIFAGNLVHPNYPEKAGYLPEVAAEDTGSGPAAPAGPPDFGRLFADQAQLATLVTHGQQVTAVCGACHDFTEGGPNKTGPNLYGIVGEKIADVPGFSFSEALKAHSSETWDYEKLNQWLISPKTFAPGTKMTYAGDKDDKDRANLIAYLSTLSKSPVPFPAPAAPAAPTTGASSEAAPAAPSSEAAPAATSSEAPAAPASSSEAAPAASSAPASSEAAPSSSSAAQ